MPQNTDTLMFPLLVVVHALNGAVLQTPEQPSRIRGEGGCGILQERRKERHVEGFGINHLLMYFTHVEDKMFSLISGKVK